MTHLELMVIDLFILVQVKKLELHAIIQSRLADCFPKHARQTSRATVASPNLLDDLPAWYETDKYIWVNSLRSVGIDSGYRFYVIEKRVKKKIIKIHTASRISSLCSSLSSICCCWGCCCCWSGRRDEGWDVRFPLGPAWEGRIPPKRPGRGWWENGLGDCVWWVPRFDGPAAVVEIPAVYMNWTGSFRILRKYYLGYAISRYGYATSGWGELSWVDVEEPWTDRSRVEYSTVVQNTLGTLLYSTLLYSTLSMYGVQVPWEPVIEEGQVLYTLCYIST